MTDTPTTDLIAPEAVERLIHSLDCAGHSPRSAAAIRAFKKGSPHE